MFVFCVLLFGVVGCCVGPFQRFLVGVVRMAGEGSAASLEHVETMFVVVVEVFCSWCCRPSVVGCR